MTKVEIFKLAAIVAAAFPHLPPDETTVRLWARSKRLARILYSDGEAAVLELADGASRYSLAEICDQADRIAGRRRIEAADRMLEEPKRAMETEREKASAQVVFDVVKKGVRFDSAADFNAEVERRLAAGGQS